MVTVDGGRIRTVYSDWDDDCEDWASISFIKNEPESGYNGRTEKSEYKN